MEQPHQAVGARYGDARSVGLKASLRRLRRAGQHGQPRSADQRITSQGSMRSGRGRSLASGSPR
jgi:hypothetical protein